MLRLDLLGVGYLQELHHRAVLHSPTNSASASQCPDAGGTPPGWAPRKRDTPIREVIVEGGPGKPRLNFLQC